MKKSVMSVICIIVVTFVFLPPAINFWVSTPAPIGFVSSDMQDVWIGFYAALAGGGLTLAGVVLTIIYNERTRKEDFEKREKELDAEYKKRDLDTKVNLAARYKPILTMSCNSDFALDNKAGDFRIKNIIDLTKETSTPNRNQKRMAISLNLSNIGRGEAQNLKIRSAISCKNKSDWKIVDREHEELYVSNRLVLMFYSEPTGENWGCYNNKFLDAPMMLYVEVTYDDLVGFHHKLESVITIHRFISMRDESNQIIPNVLIVNPYDTLILNSTKTEMGVM